MKRTAGCELWTADCRLTNGPSTAACNPVKPACRAYSRRSSLPLRSRMSNTPERPLPYSAGKAPVRKSELLITVLLRMLMPPPELPSPVAKWLGFGISMPSIRHNSPRAELPRMTISLLLSLADDTPAKDCAMRAGSLKLPAKREVSSTENLRALTVAISLSARSLPCSEAVMVTVFSSSTDSCSSMLSTTSLPEPMSTCGSSRSS